MPSIFDQATWITLGRDPDEYRTNVNPWEYPITDEIRNEPMPKGCGIATFYKKFQVKAGLQTATIYITSLGCFNLYVNGSKISKDELAPGWTDFNKRVLYYTYDITANLALGDNALAVPVSPGWWAGRISLGTYGDTDPALICALELTYADGSKETIYSDTDWQGTLNGPVRYADIWDGEVYDANFDGYDVISKADYPAERLNKKPMVYTMFKGVISEKIGPSVCVREEFDMKPVTATVFEGADDNGSDFGVIDVKETLTAPAASGKIVLKKGQGVNYDLGQNMVGWAHFTVKGAQGTTITLRHGEMLNDSGLLSRGNDGPEGSLYTANYRSAKAKGKYTLKGAPEGETYRPAFTFFGFRYIELTADGDIEIENFRCDVVGSETPDRGWLETSSKDINQLYSNIRWGQRGNYLSVPTDCPQRDETLGWAGDTQVFACTGAYNAYVLEFFRKWLQDARDSQNEQGMYPDVIPHSRVIGYGSGAWSDCGIVVPYMMYKMYGDKSILLECYDSMVKYMDWLGTTNCEGPCAVYADWLAYEPTEPRFVSIAYYAYDLILMEKMCRALSAESGDRYDCKANEMAAQYEKVCAHFQAVYLDASGKMTQTSQTAYLMALKFGLLPENDRDEAKAILKQKIVDNDYTLSCGFVGTSTLNQTLSELGESNLAYSLLLQRRDPSWLYSVDQGATTIWERWNSYTKERGFGNVGMNSFNHYAYGAVAEWMYRYMLGIDTCEDGVGFKHILLQPKPDLRTPAEMPAGQEKVTWVRGYYDSVSGKIEASWTLEEGVFAYTVVVPAGTKATLYLPICEGAATYVVDGATCAADGCRKDGCLVIDVVPGEHRFESRV